MQQVLLGSARLSDIFLTVKICLEKQIMRCSLPRKRFTTVPFEEVNYFCIYAVDLARGVLKTSCRHWFPKVRFLNDARRWRKTSKATHDSVARVSRGTRRGLDFELRQPDPKLKSGCSVWQTLWLTIVWEFLHGNEYEHIFLSACLAESFPIGSERKHKVDFFA